MLTAPGSGRGRSGRWIPPLLFCVTAAIYVLTISPDPSPDVFSADFAAWHIAQTGQPVPDIADFPALDHNIIRETWIVRTADGREAIGRAPGVIAASVPAYWLLAPDTLTAIPGGIVAALLTAGTVTLLFGALRRRTGDRVALVAAVVLGLATPMWSVAADGVWPHTLTTFGIVGMAWAADRERWWLVGLFGGVALWGRLHAALVCAVLGLGVALLRRRPEIALRVGLVSGAMLGLMAVWTHWMYGSWDPSSGYRAGDFTDNVATYALDPTNLLGFWVSADRGLLVWTPLLLVLAPAVVRGWRELPDGSRMLLVAGLAYLVVQGLLNRFSGGDAFYAYRTSLELLACAAPACALSLDRVGPVARRWLVPLAVLQVVLIAPGAVIDDLHVPVAEVWYHNAFVVGVLTRPAETLPVIAVAVMAALALLAVVRRWQGTAGAGTAVPAAPDPADQDHS